MCQRQIQRRPTRRRDRHDDTWTPPADPNEELADDTDATLEAIDAALEAGQ
jgi:hypothetical protein